MGIQSFRELVDVVGSINMAAHKMRVLTSIVRATTWMVWKAGNDFIFNSCPLLVSNMVDKMVVSVYSWMKHIAKMLDVL